MRRSLPSAVSLLLVAACVDGSDPANFGTLQAELQTPGKPAGNNEKVAVTLVKIAAHHETAGWVTLSSTKQTVDLTSFNAEALKLGAAWLPAGRITQLRLYPAEGGPHYAQLKSGQTVPLTVPPEVLAGVSIEGPFELGFCQQTVATIFMDGNKSIRVEGNDWQLRPEIKLRGSSTRNVQCPGEPSSAAPAVVQLPHELLDSAGAACTGGYSCMSGVCEEGSCAPSLPGGACSSKSDCGAGKCGEGGSCR